MCILSLPLSPWQPWVFSRMSQSSNQTSGFFIDVWTSLSGSSQSVYWKYHFDLILVAISVTTKYNLLNRFIRTITRHCNEVALKIQCWLLLRFLGSFRSHIGRFSFCPWKEGSETRTLVLIRCSQPLWGCDWGRSWDVDANGSLQGRRMCIWKWHALLRSVTCPWIKCLSHTGHWLEVSTFWASITYKGRLFDRNSLKSLI